MKNCRPMFCPQCKGKDIEVKRNVGWDITEDGEEHQHLDRCRGCGNERIWADTYSYDDGPGTTWSGWDSEREAMIAKPTDKEEPR